MELSPLNFFSSGKRSHKTSPKHTTCFMNYLISSLLKRSSEIPFVSGIMNKTNTSWITVIPANSMKTYPGFGNADKATGMKSVIRAASAQWTEHPNDWP
jgi:hypothetical protein